MRKSEQKQLGELLFKVTQMPATRGARTSQLLMRTVLPALAQAAAGLGLEQAKGLGDIDLGKLLGNLGTGLNALFDKLPPEEFERMWRELFEFVEVTVDGRTAPLLPVFDDVLAGKMMTFYKLVAFALEVNFQDFFQELAARLAWIPTASVSRSKGSATSATSGSVGVS